MSTKIRREMMEITPKNQNIIVAPPESIVRKRKLECSITPEECSQKTLIKLKIKTVEQQCNVKAKVFSHWRYTEYVDDIIDELKRSEMNRPEFRYQSPQIAYRKYCVTFMREVAEQETVSRTTLHLGIYYLDIFMDRHRIAVERLSLVVLCCLCIASKIEDRDQDVPKYSDLNFQLNNIYSLADYQRLERMIVQSFGFKLIYPTAAVFVEYYIEAIVSEVDYQKNSVSENKNSHNSSYNSWIHMKVDVADRVLEILDLTIHYCEMVQMTPSKLAAACMAAARWLCNIENVWTTELALLTNYLFKDIEPLMMVLLNYRSEFIGNNLPITEIGEE